MEFVTLYRPHKGEGKAESQATLQSVARRLRAEGASHLTAN